MKLVGVTLFSVLVFAFHEVSHIELPSLGQGILPCEPCCEIESAEDGSENLSEK